MKKIKSSIYKFYIKIYNFFKNLWEVNVSGPRNKRKQEKLELESIEDLKKNFEKTFKVSVESMKRNITLTAPTQTDTTYRTEKIIEARKYFSENLKDISKAPSLIDLDIIDKHNNEGGYTDKSLEQIIAIDDIAARKTLNEIGGDKTKKLSEKAKTIWATRA